MKYALIPLLALILLGGCGRRDQDVIYPVAADDLPQILLFDDEGDGDTEDSDEIEITLTLADRVDPSGDDLRGTVVPLTEAVTVAFQVEDIAGIATLGDYILDWSAYYEIDDCTTSDDEGIDLGLSFDPVSGAGSVTFPAGIEEMVLAFEVREDLLDDDVFNAEGRGFTVVMTGLTTGSEAVVFNPDLTFTYQVLDDEGIYGKWELDPGNATEWAAFQTLFGLVSPDIAALSPAEVDAIELEFAYDALAVVVVLVETETVTECGESEEENLEIEIEAEYDDLTDDALEGELALIVEVEQADGTIEEAEYAGSFTITGSSLALTLEGAYDEAETGEQVLNLEK